MSANESKLKFSVDSPALRLSTLRAEYDALLKKHTKLAPALQDMYTTLRTLAQEVDALRDRVGHALAAVRGFPESIHVDDIPDGCPGWTMSEPAMPPCQQCPHKWDCFEAGH
jgi:hypothetical protein